MRDNFPTVECRPDLCGTDVVEDLWSKNGQWIGNKYNYTYGYLQINISHMIRLEKIRINPNASQFAKAHPKQENIWNRKYVGQPRIDLTAYPLVGAEVLSLKTGIREERRLA